MRKVKNRKQFGFGTPDVRLWSFMLALFFIMIFPHAGFSESQETNSPEPAEVKQSDNQEQHTILVYYFHGTKRCTSCKKIESWSHDAIHNNFADNLKTEKMIWKPVNTDKPENKHFIKDFQLYTKSLVLVEMKGKEQTRWKNLKKVWQLLNNEKSFHEYITQETDNFIKGL